MTTRSTFSLVLAIACVAHLGCAAHMTGGCGYGPACGVPACGLPEATCACPPDVTCGCPRGFEPGCEMVDAACGLPATCGVPTGCGSAVGPGQCPLANCQLLRGIRNFFCGTGGGACAGCSYETYRGDWHEAPPCHCEECQMGTVYGGARGRSQQMARQQLLNY